MSDLVERLRKYVDTDEGYYWTGPIMSEAAAEIERLTAKNKRFVESLEKTATLMREMGTKSGQTISTSWVLNMAESILAGKAVDIGND